MEQLVHVADKGVLQTKVGYEATIPISPLVRAALDRIVQERPGIGTAPLFPSPADPTKPITRHLADKWLRR